MVERRALRGGKAEDAVLNDTTEATNNTEDTESNDAIQTDVIPYLQAIRQAKEILNQIEANQLRLGELADRVEPKYGDGTLARFAKAIGVPHSTLERWRSVYCAWKDVNPAPGPELKYAVLRELACLPNRAELVATAPHMTKRDAAKLARKYKDEQRAAEPPPMAEEVWRAWQADLLIIANKVREPRWSDDGNVPELPAGIGVDPLLLKAVTDAARILTALASKLEQLSDREIAALDPPTVH